MNTAKSFGFWIVETMDPITSAADTVTARIDVRLSIQ